MFSGSSGIAGATQFFPNLQRLGKWSADILVRFQGLVKLRRTSPSALREKVCGARLMGATPCNLDGPACVFI